MQTQLFIDCFSKSAKKRINVWNSRNIYPCTIWSLSFSEANTCTQAPAFFVMVANNKFKLLCSNFQFNSMDTYCQTILEQFHQTQCISNANSRLTFLCSKVKTTGLFNLASWPFVLCESTDADITLVLMTASQESESSKSEQNVLLEFGSSRYSKLL